MFGTSGPWLGSARLGPGRGRRALGVSHSTVARRVEALEARLAARLLDRNRDGYLLTDAGRQMLPGAERMEREISATEPESGSDPTLHSTSSKRCGE